MLNARRQSARLQNGLPGPHDYIAHASVPTPRPSPPPLVPGLSANPSMESSRAGLPPPSSLALPPPDVGFTTMNAVNQSLPPPPPQRQNSDPSFYSWLESKTEEDRRRQEEEKTRQESLRLEQRKIEQSMLRDSLQAGVPPHLIPLIFAGISQGGVPQCVLDLTQQYMPQPAAGARGPATPLLNAAHPLPRHVSHVRQDSRSLPSNPYAAAPPPQPVSGPGVLLSQPLHPPGASPTMHSLSRPPLPSNSTDPRPPGAPTARAIPGDAQPPPPSINLSNVQYAPGSDVTTSSETGAPGLLDTESVRPFVREMPHEDSHAARRRADTSTSDTNPPLPRPSLHTRYAASVEPGPRDSDLDSSPGPSPTTRTHSTQSGREALPAGPHPRGR
ncbi:hypothetical protein ATERTT37_005297 [Aspergillus terreus]